MYIELWWILAAVAGLSVAILLIWRSMRIARREARFAVTRRDFHAQRERLEAKFVQLASVHAKPRGPHWADCDFDDDVAYVRDRRTGQLQAFVGVTVAIENFDDASTRAGEAIGNLRAGTAVFRFDRDHWETDGRAILNLTPTEAIRLYRRDLEMVDQELAQRR